MFSDNIIKRNYYHIEIPIQVNDNIFLFELENGIVTVTKET